jgi:histone H3/H4
MIEVGDMTIIGTTTYRCIRIDNDDNVFLKNILHDKGRALVYKRDLCPYIENNLLVVPEQPKKKRMTTRVNISKVVKESTNLVVSNTAKRFLVEWVDTAIANLIANAEENAALRGKQKITAADLFWLETNNLPSGHWKDNEVFFKE